LREEDSKTSRPPPPEISSFIEVGLNSVTRSLVSLSQKSKVLKSADGKKNDAAQDPHSPTSEAKKEKSDAGQALRSPSSGAQDNASSGNKKPLNNAAQNTQSPASAVETENSDAGQVSRFSTSKATSDASNHIEASLEDPQIQEPAASRGESQKSAADCGSAARRGAREAQVSPIEEEGIGHHFSAIFVPRSSQPENLHAHLPQLIATASLAHPELPATRLVQLPQGCEARLCEALHLPRVSLIGLLDSAPHSKSLLDVVRRCVPEIEVPWLQEAKKSVYLPVKINAIETFAPIRKKEQKVVV